ncbi:hypothetical protein OEZ49_15350 [Ruegeria sp. WL0004]|uniref:DNA-binding protein n=1 Tax=Ruegeria marisflavi TaxID=2984152 RepID=A0ABT2WTB5_9RHOB|nr:hypothetical protein [Ruegeria sp. WL0004]MCU9839151.1 hypothetical protein [Ruegeria sp. WL0004]
MTVITTTPMLTIAEKAVELGTTPESLRRWRLAGTGPAYVKYGGVVRYYPEKHSDVMINGLRTDDYNRLCAIVSPKILDKASPVAIQLFLKALNEVGS